MVKNHLKRLRMPNKWPIPRKTATWVTKPNPGPHKIENSLPLNLIIRELLNYAKITKEVKKILNNGEVLINNKIRKDHRFPVGLFDIIEIPKTKENYVMILNKKGKLHLQKIEKSDTKYSKIIGKKVLKKNKVQINTHDSKNILSDKKEYKVNDTLVIDLKNNKILKNLKFDKGSYAFITSGKYSGNHGEIEENNGNQVEIKIGKEKVKVPKKYIFIVEKGFIKDE